MHSVQVVGGAMEGKGLMRAGRAPWGADIADGK